MCWLTDLFKSKPNTPQTVEEIIDENSIGMTDAQKAQYWYELSQNIFSLLGKVDVPVYELGVDEWLTTVQAQYPTLTNIKIAEFSFTTTSLDGLILILKKDWTNLVPYQMPAFKCDNFATLLYSHLVLHYGIKAVVPVWGETDGGYHGFNLAVLKQNDEYIARLIEPQTDCIFVEQGPLGKYIPRQTAVELGIKKYEGADI